MNFLLLLFLLCGTLYNFDNYIVRLIVLVLWASIPLMILSLVSREKISYSVFSLISKEILFFSCFYSLLLLCWIYNLDSLKISISGAAGEMLTPHLYIFHVISISAVFVMLRSNMINFNIVNIFYYLLVFLLFVDMVIRIYEGPTLFMNYNQRFSAKNMGLFVNTNVLGQAIVFMIIIADFIKLKYKKFIQLILIILLVTTMARAAILSLCVTYSVKWFWREGIMFKICSILGVVGIFLIFSYLNLDKDGSLLSKFEFFSNTLILFNNGSIYDVIFGFGASFDLIVLKLNVGEFSPHLSILKAFLYYGIIGVVFFILILYKMYLHNKKMAFPILSFLILGLTGAPIYWPTLTVGLILLLINDYYSKGSK